MFNFCLLLLAAISALFCPMVSVVAAEQRIFIGTYTKKGSEGIYTLRFDDTTGHLSSPVLAARASNPSFLAAGPRRRMLYAATDTGRRDGKPVGTVTSYRVDETTGLLVEQNHQETGGAAPCHVAVDATGTILVAANYADGNIALFPIEPDGRPAALAQTFTHLGRGPNRQRQDAPHAHGAHFSPDNRFVATPDLGIDQIRIYRFDAAQGRLAENEPAFGTVAPGSGPRHLAFHPTGPWAYVINELAGTITTFAWDATRGALTEIDTVATLPATFTGQNTTAEVAVHPNGRFLYGSNRGHDSIAVFALDPATGKPALVQHQPSGGKAPRHFTLAPSGRFLLAANQDSDQVVVFRIDPASGQLSPTGQQATISMPVCVLFW